MSEPPDASFDLSYVSGLLDATARVRFDVSENDGEFTVRPTIRIKHGGSPMRKAVLGSFLDAYEFDYRLVARDLGDEFFLIELGSDIDRMRELLTGRSAHLIRELDFVGGTYSRQFDTEILDPVGICRFLKTRDELYHGWRPRGVNYRTLDETAAEFDVDADQLEISPIPDGRTRDDYSLEWIAGVYDGLCRYRPSVGQTDEYEIGYAMYPTARMHRAGINPLFVDQVVEFCDDYNLKYGDSSTDTELNIVFTGPANIRRILELVLPDTYVLYEPSEILLEAILPRFDEEEHHTREGFLQLLIDFEEIAQASGEFSRRRTYTAEYFAEEWKNELDLNAISDSEMEVESVSDPLDGYGSVSVDPQTFAETPGRFRSLVDRVQRDPSSAAELKRLYSDRCQVCSKRLAKGDGTGYSEVHHIRPLGEPHGGPDAVENMLVLCPNHHADFDNGVIKIDADSLQVSHPYDESVDGTELLLHERHRVDEDYLRYHDEHILQLDTEPTPDEPT